MARKSTKKGTRAAATRSSAKAESGTGATGDRLLKSVWHDGKNYDPKKPADQAAFRQLVEREGKLGDTDKKTGAPRAKLNLQFLADRGVINGFGVKAKTKAAERARTRAEKEEFSGEEEEQNTSAPVGGGVDAVDEQELMEGELEEQEDER